MLEVSGGLRDSKNKKILIIVGAVLLVAVAGYFFWQYLVAKSDPTAANKETVTRVTDQVKAILQVPSDEEPQVATVTNADKLKDQPFFAGVQKDDYLIVYQKAKLAILYREKDRKLINVDHVELTPNQN
ncbi:MAG TPA: hypothetical protein VM581_04075 [Magnetospirillaceae bacterium]|nr:hypothetical protein [Magnetospirillaceae bacterium]